MPTQRWATALEEFRLPTTRRSRGSGPASALTCNGLVRAASIGRARQRGVSFRHQLHRLFAGTWGAIAEMRAHPIGVALNEKPKYVASNTLTDPQWANTTVLSGDVAAAIGERPQYATATAD